MVLISLNLAICFVILFGRFVQARIRYHLILVWFALSWIMKYLKLRCMLFWRVYMHVRSVINCGLVLWSYYRVLVFWLWRYLEQESWRLWSVGLMIRGTSMDCGRDGLFWRQYIIWCFMGVRDGHGTWVFVSYNMELDLMRRIFYGSIGLFLEDIYFSFFIGAKRFFLRLNISRSSGFQS